ncbi:MAG: GyrI-like domain-containing protein [Candidatus Cloacimonetes bacterium]|nr:GyrI-like domain-containing protein [Candidatus Cloacimonadota bacterium]
MNLLKKFLKVIIIIFCVALILLLILAILMGAFNKVELERTQRGPYTIACLSHTGPYHLIYKKIEKVDSILSEQKIGKLSACGIYYDSPAEVPQNLLKSKGGFIISKETQIDSSLVLEVEIIPQREVILAKFKGHPAIASLKIYPEIHKWLEKNEYRPFGACLEIYYDEKLVECEMPIKLPE